MILLRVGVHWHCDRTMIVRGKGSKLLIYDVIYGETQGQKLSKISVTLIANIKLLNITFEDNLEQINLR